LGRAATAFLAVYLMVASVYLLRSPAASPWRWREDRHDWASRNQGAFSAAHVGDGDP
jgi:hypothetical protein